MISETVENIARMDIQERDTFVKTLVTKWPDLATSVNNMITLEQMVQEKLYEKSCTRKVIREKLYEEKSYTWRKVI